MLYCLQNIQHLYAIIFPLDCDEWYYVRSYMRELAWKKSNKCKAINEWNSATLVSWIKLYDKWMGTAQETGHFMISTSWTK